VGSIAPRYRERKFAAWNARSRSIYLSGAKILFGDDLARDQVYEADGVIIVIRDERSASVGANGDARRLRPHVGAKSGFVAKRDFASERELRATAGERVESIVHASTDDETGEPYPDYDGFTFYSDADIPSICEHARQMAAPS